MLKFSHFRTAYRLGAHRFKGILPFAGGPLPALLSEDAILYRLTPVKAQRLEPLPTGCVRWRIMPAISIAWRASRHQSPLAAFCQVNLDRLWAFLDALSADFHYGVEVRHPAFFTKQVEERALNRGLQQQGVNWVILDSRPIHAVVTAGQPLVRFIGADDPDDNVALFQPWLARLPQWATVGNAVFVYPHAGYCLRAAAGPAFVAEIGSINPRRGPNAALATAGNTF